MTKEELLHHLIQEWKMPKDAAATMLSELEQAPASIRDAYEHWLDDGNIVEIQREGISARILVEKCGMNPAGAFHTLYWLDTEPVNALRTLKKLFQGVL